ncbi:MAG: heat-inducible transcriptional repressor HrcA [Proteobacteria bacterium]|nr:heat-inducible transcriptional repressor HrcA [Pseudomonadota bacterium]MCH8163005.1 heat-inducible transcriptional repressor HrcA [Pseudomonadota bacterium]MCH9048157.1 heat-inducible transcriptional repressor HrcA [Pseudomonadota bacterium]
MPKSKKSQELPERSLFLFKSLVEHFINDGQPVGSRTLVRDLDLDLSAATIRNVMADLEDMGFLRSPHTSAGRIPTARGYRLFVDSLLRVNDLGSEEIHRIAEEMDSVDSIQNLLERTSSMLSDITHLASVVMLPRLEQSTLNQVEFMSLSDNRILVILVMSDNEIQNKIIHTARTFSASELEQAANYLNKMFSDKDLPEIRKEMLAELKSMKDNVNQLMQAAIEMAQQAIDSGSKDDYVLAGETNLMGVSGWGDIDRLKRLFDTFNRKRDILHLLEQSINAKGVQIFIGEESGYEVLDDCSVVTSPYESEGQILGVLGVIGPTRMDYERVIPIVDLTAKMLGSALNSM